MGRAPANKFCGRKGHLCKQEVSLMLPGRNRSQPGGHAEPLQQEVRRYRAGRPGQIGRDAGCGRIQGGIERIVADERHRKGDGAEMARIELIEA